MFVSLSLLMISIKVYRDYHLLPVHSEGLKKYFGDIIEI
jgi:hypothetical protein